MTSNLLLAGRIISASHVAFSSTRVQLTLAQAAQAVGVAAALCTRQHLLPADLSLSEHIPALQREVLRRGQFIPHVRLDDPADLAPRAAISASSALTLTSLPADGPLLPLTHSTAQVLPVAAGIRIPAITFCLDVSSPTTLIFELRTSNIPEHYTPDVLLEAHEVHLQPGMNQRITFESSTVVEQARYVFACLMKNPDVAVHTSETRITGILSVSNTQNPAVSNYGAQQPTEDIGVEAFEFWVPSRRPRGHNLAFSLNAPLEVFGAANVVNGWGRPTSGPNAWVAALHDSTPTLHLEWPEVQCIARLDLTFDTDFDHPMETVLMTHPERVVPFCIRHYRVLEGNGAVVAEMTDNHLTCNSIRFDPPLQTSALHIEVCSTYGAPAALFEVRCYADWE